MTTLGIGFVGWLLVLYIGITSAFAAQCVDDFCWMYPRCPKMLCSLFMFVITFVFWLPVFVFVLRDIVREGKEIHGSERKHRQG